LVVSPQNLETSYERLGVSIKFNFFPADLQANRANVSKVVGIPVVK